MPYVYIWGVCYVLAFIVINIRLATQRANMEAHIETRGDSAEEFLSDFRESFREMMPLSKEIIIRLWAPFFFSLLPAGLLSLAYFFFS